MKRKLFIILIFLILVIIYPQAQEIGSGEEEETIITYDLGDQIFSVNAALFVPLFFHFYNNTVNPFQSAYTSDYAHMSLGGAASLEWSAFLNNNLTLGFELGGMFSFTPNLRTVVMLPLTGQIGWNFRFYPFEIPIFIGAGVVVNILEDNLFIGPILKPGVSAFYTYNSEWSFGLNLVYWWVPEIYFDEVHKEQSAFGNFLEISISALRHF